MAWTTPRTYTVGEIITKTILDTHVRDNLKYLKGESGVPTIESGLIIDNTGGDEYLQIPSLTTTERDALTPVNGMIIYNETTTEFNKYEAGAWVDLADNTDHGGLDGLGDDDHTQYQLKSLLTTQADIIYATGASAWARLAKGGANEYLRMNAGATAPEWTAGALVPAGFIGIWAGTIANIPSGYVICDGNNGTPNLLTRFVEGVATAATDPGATGGATNKTTSSVAGSIPYGTTSNTAVTDHSHTISDIRPLYYDVAFIQKT